MIESDITAPDRVAILWKGWSGYLAGCAIELGRECGLPVLVIAVDKHLTDAPYEAPSDPNVSWLLKPTNHDASAAVAKFAPTILLICGWDTLWFLRMGWTYRKTATRVIYFDNQWRRKPKQWLGILTAPLLLWPVFDFAFVPGSRQLEFAKRLGYDARRASSGGCSASTRLIARTSSPGRGFIFVGRLVSEKGIETLVDAYAMYRQMVRDPWTMTVYGTGPLQRGLDQDGIDYRGFAQPDELLATLATFGCLVLPSEYEPWAVVVHEAAFAGLGLLTSDAVGAGDHFIDVGVNGRVHPYGSVGALAADMAWFSELSASERARARQASETRGESLSEETWARQLLQMRTRQKARRVWPWFRSLLPER